MNSLILYNILQLRCKICGHDKEYHYIMGMDLQIELLTELINRKLINASDVYFNCTVDGCQCNKFEPYSLLEICELIEEKYETRIQK